MMEDNEEYKTDLEGKPQFPLGAPQIHRFNTTADIN